LTLSPGPLSHSLNGDGPPDQAGLVTFDKQRSAAAEFEDIATSRLNTTVTKVSIFNGKTALVNHPARLRGRPQTSAQE
jgi:hypothetical protein